MATVEQCRAALDRLAQRLAAVDHDTRSKKALDRTLSCHLTDLGVDFRGRLAGGTLTDIEQAPDPRAKIKLASTSDDLVALTDGTLSFPTAWSSGRLKVDASIFDLLKLRSML